MGLKQKINDFISIISPSWALERQQYQAAYDEIRRFQGAKITEHDKYWLPSNMDADGEILNDLPRLRARVRDLIRNNPWAKRIIKAKTDNVVGRRGIMPQIPGNERLEALLIEKLNSLDITGKQKWPGLLRQIYWSYGESGESFSRIVITGRRRNRELKLQLIEPDQIYTNLTTQIDENREIRGGVEIDKKTGRHLAYYINTHPGDSGQLRLEDEERILAMDMIHLFNRTRANQTRGIPDFYHAVIIALRDIGEIVDSERVAFRVATCLAALHIRKTFAPGEKNKKSEKIQRLSPGMIFEGQQGDDLKIIDPKRPGQHFSTAMRTLLQSVAVGSNMSYATISGDYEGPNFSAQRLDKIGEIRGYECEQSFLIDEFCQRVSDEILNIEFLKGNAPDPRTINVEWVPEGFEWVDPDKDVKAVLKLNANNLLSKKRIARKKGMDIEKIYEEIAQEIELEEALGIKQTIDMEAGDGEAEESLLS